jgi:hypothetical protein
MFSFKTLVGHPGDVAEELLEEPKVGVAFIIVLLPTLTGFATAYIFLSQASVRMLAQNMLMNVLAWFAIASVVYIVALAVRGKIKITGRFKGILSALSLIWVFLLFSSLAAALLLAAFPPSLHAFFKQARDAGLSETDALALLFYLESDRPDDAKQVLENAGVDEQQKKNLLGFAGKGLLDNINLPLAFLSLILQGIFMLYAFLIVPVAIAGRVFEVDVLESFFYYAMVGAFSVVALGFIKYALDLAGL